MTTAMRQSMLYSLTGYWLFFTPIMLIGIRPEYTMALYAMNLGYQFFAHTESIRKMPAWYEYVFVTPSHHRVHHGRNPQYIDKNYAGVFIIWDRLFGTFTPEGSEPSYGTVKPLASFNPFWANVEGFAALAADQQRLADDV